MKYPIINPTMLFKRYFILYENTVNYIYKYSYYNNYSNCIGIPTCDYIIVKDGSTHGVGYLWGGGIRRMGVLMWWGIDVSSS